MSEQEKKSEPFQQDTDDFNVETKEDDTLKNKQEGFSNYDTRKLDDFNALSLVEQKVYSMSPTQLIFQKEY